MSWAEETLFGFMILSCFINLRSEYSWNFLVGDTLPGETIAKLNLEEIGKLSTWLFLFFIIAITTVLCSIMGLFVRFVHRTLGSIQVEPVVQVVSPYEWQQFDWTEGHLYLRTLDSTKLFKGKSNSANRKMRLEKILSNCSPVQADSDLDSKTDDALCLVRNTGQSFESF